MCARLWPGNFPGQIRSVKGVLLMTRVGSSVQNLKPGPSPGLVSERGIIVAMYSTITSWTSLTCHTLFSFWPEAIPSTNVIFLDSGKFNVWMEKKEKGQHWGTWCWFMIFPSYGGLKGLLHGSIIGRTNVHRNMGRLLSWRNVHRNLVPTQIVYRVREGQM